MLIVLIFITVAVDRKSDSVELNPGNYTLLRFNLADGQHVSYGEDVEYSLLRLPSQSEAIIIQIGRSRRITSPSISCSSLLFLNHSRENYQTI